MHLLIFIFLLFAFRIHLGSVFISGTFFGIEDVRSERQCNNNVGCRYFDEFCKQESKVILFFFFLLLWILLFCPVWFGLDWFGLLKLFAIFTKILFFTFIFLHCYICIFYSKLTKSFFVCPVLILYILHFICLYVANSAIIFTYIAHIKKKYNIIMISSVIIIYIFFNYFENLFFFYNYCDIFSIFFISTF